MWYLGTYVLRLFSIENGDVKLALYQAWFWLLGVQNWHGRYSATVALCRTATWLIMALQIMPIFDFGMFGDSTLAMILSRYAYCDLKNEKKIANVYNIGDSK